MNSLIENDLGMTAEQEKLFRQLRKQVPDDMFLRECIVNSIEAEASRINIGPSSLYPEKLSIADDGTGFEDFEKSMKPGAVTKGAANFGLGGKMAGLKRSDRLDYFSVRNGQYSGWTLALDPAAESRPIPFPARLVGHLKQGTEVILQGHGAADITLRLPDMQGQDKWDRDWIQKSVNRRFWSFPKGVTVHCADQNPTAAAPYRRAHGLEYLLWGSCQERGTMSATTVFGKCLIHWFILPERNSKNKTGKKQSRDRIINAAGLSGGVTAVLLHMPYGIQELHDIHKGEHSLLPYFGLRYAKDRIFLIIEPCADMQIEPHITRTGVIMGKDADPFPYSAVAEVFRKHMPPALRKLIEQNKSISQGQRDRYVDSKLYDLFAPAWHAAAMKGSKGSRVPASPGVVIGIGGPHAGERKTTIRHGKKRVGIGPVLGSVPDKSSSDIKLVRQGRGLPEIQVHIDSDQDNSWAMSFSCNDTDNFSDCALVINSNWHRWEEYENLPTLFGREKLSREAVYAKVKGPATAAIYSALMDIVAGKESGKKCLAQLHGYVTLTSIADSTRYHMVDGVRRDEVL